MRELFPDDQFAGESFDASQIDPALPDESDIDAPAICDYSETDQAWQSLADIDGQPEAISAPDDWHGNEQKIETPEVKEIPLHEVLDIIDSTPADAEPELPPNAVARLPINEDTPWWALPEEVDDFTDRPCDTREELLEIAAAKQTAFDEERAAKPKRKGPSPSSLEGMISATEGPLLEVGGPSQLAGGKTMIDFKAVDKPLIVSNVVREYVRNIFWRSPIYGETFSTERPGRTYRFRGEENLVDRKTRRKVECNPDAKIDATDMPEGEGYLGALYTRALTASSEPPFVNTEAPRVLEPGGMLVVQGMKPETFQEFKDTTYFDILRARRLSRLEGSRHSYNVVARRNSTPYSTPAR